MKKTILGLMVVLVSGVAQSVYAGEAQVIMTIKRSALWNDRKGQCVVEGTIKLLHQHMLNPIQISDYYREDGIIQFEMPGYRVSTWSDHAVVCPAIGKEASGVLIEKGGRLILDGSFQQ